MTAIEKDVVIATAPTQLCVGIPSACEVTVQVLSSVFAKEESEAILLVDATNASNSVNRAAALHNIPRVCPAAGQVFVNAYQADVPCTWMVARHSTQERARAKEIHWPWHFML